MTLSELLKCSTLRSNRRSKKKQEGAGSLCAHKDLMISPLQSDSTIIACPVKNMKVLCSVRFCRELLKTA
jgi:hypothetical protein